MDLKLTMRADRSRRRAGAISWSLLVQAVERDAELAPEDELEAADRRGPPGLPGNQSAVGRR